MFIIVLRICEILYNRDTNDYVGIFINFVYNVLGDKSNVEKSRLK